ncbi:MULTISPECIES: LysR family transcriptional regulator [Duganella]|uniref:LysR family transcriptional regulator n=1 Tax=Duganella zoogloeoides TaxID=75659 RepID=A0ABZ0Y4H9_9BURK|nr:MULTISPECIES: LysR family transcriptional regulator [Duganella]KQN70770.1 LysR family transcriptional regulator [Duganella sp. Leaf61]MPQ57811.1 LysR family transcriptional regulator [Duganella sp. FT27W]WQH06362.1 LysR family transcriptional regulator [Duganella zoogloeoides]
MKIDDISAFVAVVRNQSISAAADALGLTQSAITRRVQNLEQALGVELLDRSVKPPKPSAMGKQVYEQCAKVLLEVERLRDLVQEDHAPTGVFRIGVIQTIGDVVLLDTLQKLNQAFDGLHTEVASGWGAQLVQRVDKGEIDAAVALFPATKVLPDGLRGRTLGRIELVVVAKKDALSRRAYKLRDIFGQGWVLNPDGCGFRAGLARALAEQGLSFKINLETFGTDLQLGLVANGVGLGLMPRPILERSRHRAQLDIVNVTDFKPVLDIWLVQPLQPGPVQHAIDLFAESVEQAFAAAPLKIVAR